jgi:hypothetical protein
MALRGYLRPLNRHGAWWRRIAIGGAYDTVNYPPFYIEPTSEPTATAVAGDMYVNTSGELLVHNGTSYVSPARRVVSVSLPLNGDAVDQYVFIADGAYVVERVDYIHATAGSDGSAVNLQVKKCTSTQAPDAGSNLLTNNTNAGFNCKGTAATVQNGTLTGTAATKTLAAGNRLSLDFTGTTTALAGVAVTITLRPA